MSNAKNYLLGMDLGTTNIKGIIADEEGNVEATASSSNEVLHPAPGMVEQNANDWWKNVASVFWSLTRQVPEDIIKNIKGICISSQTVTMLPVDKNGKPLRNALIWMDGRSGKEVSEIISAVGLPEFIRITGGQPDRAFLPNKILWFKKNEPELFEKTCCFLQASSFANYKLTGNMTMDIDQAIKSQCLDINTMEWSKTIGDAIGVDLNKLLPKPQKVHDVIGYVTEAAAEETGLVSGIPVLCGASDAVASMYALGLSRPGEAGESSGTSSLLFCCHTEATDPYLPVVAKPSSIAGVPYVFDAPISASGASLKWFLDLMGFEEKKTAKKMGINVYDYLNLKAMQSPAGSNGLFYFPYLLGERAPLWNNHAKGMFIGMSMSTSRQDLIRSVFEGTAYAIRHVFSVMKETGAPITSLRVTGGGAKSRTWSMIKAAMLNVPVYVMDEKAGDVPFGDVLIAGHGVGIFPNLEETMAELVQAQEIIMPNAKWAKAYDKLFPMYVDMYKHLDVDLFKLNSMAGE